MPKSCHQTQAVKILPKTHMPRNNPPQFPIQYLMSFYRPNVCSPNRLSTQRAHTVKKTHSVVFLASEIEPTQRVFGIPQQILDLVRICYSSHGYHLQKYTLFLPFDQALDTSCDYFGAHGEAD